MRKRDHGLHGVKRHTVVSDNIQDLQHDHSICLHSVFHDPGLIDLYFSLAVTELEDFPLGFFYLNAVSDPASGEIPHQKFFQNFIFPFRNAFPKWCIHICNQ